MGTTANAISVGAGLNRGAVSDILDGRSRNPGIATLASIAQALGCGLEDLILRPSTSAPTLRKKEPVPGNLADAIAAIVDPIGGIVVEKSSRRSHRGIPEFGATDESGEAA